MTSGAATWALVYLLLYGGKASTIVLPFPTEAECHQSERTIDELTAQLHYAGRAGTCIPNVISSPRGN